VRVRRATGKSKLQITDTLWRDDDMPPRFCPIYTKTRPARAGWRWRSARADAGDEEFMLVALVHPKRGDMKSTLLVKRDEGYSVVSRYEFHSSHPGLHVHAHCDRAGIEIGASGMDELQRVPPSKGRVTRQVPLSISTFWEESRRFFRIKDDIGPLFRP